MKKFLLLFVSSFMVSAHCMGDEMYVKLGVGIIDPTPIGHQTHKTPMRPPVVYQNDYVLTFSTSHPDYVLQLLDEDNMVVYEVLVLENVTQVVLPAYLAGEYTLQLIYGNWLFYGEIEL